MRKYIYLCLFCLSFCCNCLGEDNFVAYYEEYGSFLGQATNGLTPLLHLEFDHKDWYLQISYVVRKSFSRFEWLKPTNRMGSKLILWTTNRTIVPLKDHSAIAAWSLPSTTTVSNMMRGVVPRSSRGLLWWQADFNNLDPEMGTMAVATTFSLSNIYHMSFTNDFILCVGPMMYKVDTNTQSASLIQFPAMHFRLNANGTVERLSSSP